MHPPHHRSLKTPHPRWPATSGAGHTPRPEYPRPSLRRRGWVNLNGEWDFGAGPARKFDRRIVVPFAPQSALSGIGNWEEADVVWYRRRFDAARAPALLLHFGADDRVGDPSLPRGKQRTEGMGPLWFYTPTTGIWQTVWLEPLPERSIESLRVKPDLGSGSVGFETAGDGANEVIATFEGRRVGRWNGDANAGTIALGEVHPWSPEHPNLYGLDVRSESDHVSSYFGLRSIEAKQGRFWLNGEPYTQRLVLDQGY